MEDFLGEVGSFPASIQGPPGLRAWPDCLGLAGASFGESFVSGKADRRAWSLSPGQGKPQKIPEWGRKRCGWCLGGCGRVSGEWQGAWRPERLPEEELLPGEGAEFVGSGCWAAAVSGDDGIVGV